MAILTGAVKVKRWCPLVDTSHVQKPLVVLQYLIVRVDSEKCSLTKGQSNICWANARNTLQHVDVSVLNDTYLSLSSAKPRESSWTFDPVTLIVATQTSSMFFIPSTSSPSASVPTTTPPNASDLPNSSLSVSVSTTPPPNASAVPNTSSTSSPGSSTHISGGAIGGIVVGTVAVIAIGVGLGVGFLKKRNKQKVEMSEEPFFKDNGEVKAELSSRKPLQELSAETHPQELGPGYEVAELEAGK